MTGGRPVGQVRRAPHTVPTLQHRHRDPKLGRILPCVHGLGGHGTPRRTQRSEEERQDEERAAWETIDHSL
jgi:hypothetical protein